MYSKMSAASPVVVVLHKDDAVTIDFSVAGPNGGWCSVTQAVMGGKSGNVPCNSLQREPVVQLDPPAIAPAPAPASPEVALTLPTARASRIPRSPPNDSTQKLVKRLCDEAAAFQKLAPQLVGQETLHQRALAAPRFKMRVGDAAKHPQAADWKEHEIVSEYAFALLGRQIHELRQVTSVDGKRVAGETQAQDALAKLITGNDDQRKRRALEQLERYGLRGGATDFGQILLLFSRGSVERYEITISGPRLMGTVATQVFHYQQLDGPQALTVFRGNSAAGAGTTERLSVQGEIWVREADGQPVRITMSATDSATDSATGKDKPLREEATVDYAMSEFGTLLPVETTQRELRAGEEVAQNRFSYRGFHRFETRAPE